MMKTVILMQVMMMNILVVILHLKTVILIQMVMVHQIGTMIVLTILDLTKIMVVQMNQILADTVAGMHIVKENMVHNTTMMTLTTDVLKRI